MTVGWTQGASQVFCGSCHGLPPNTPVHAGLADLTTCATCHAASIDPGGALRATRAPDGGVVTRHLDGVVTFVQ